MDKLVGEHAHATIDYKVPPGIDPREEKRRRNADFDDVPAVCFNINRNQPLCGPEEVIEAVKQTAGAYGYDYDVSDEKYEGPSAARMWYKLTSALPGQTVPDLYEVKVDLKDETTGDRKGKVSFRYHVEDGNEKHPRRIWYKDRKASLEDGPGYASEEEMESFLQEVQSQLDQ